MLKTIIYREFLSNIITFRFLLGLLVCVGLVAANTSVLVWDYESRLQGYQFAVQAHTEEIRKIEVLSALAASHRPKADKKPKLTSILNQGVETRLGNSVELAHCLVPYRAEQHGADNPLLVVFPRGDLTLIFRIVISLLAFLFAYDAIAGERESGTLALALSNSVPRGTLLLGKYLGGMLSLVVPLALSLLVALQIILLSPYAVLSASDWARIGLFFLVSLIYVSVFFTLGMLFSSNSRRAATALMFVMFFWVVFVLVWPNASHFAVSKLIPLKSDDDLTMDGLIAAIARGEGAAYQHPMGNLWLVQFRREIDNYAKQHNVPAYGGGQHAFIEGTTWTWNYNGPPDKLAVWNEYMRFHEELRIRYAEKTGKMRWEYLTNYPIRQAKMSQKVARISPAGAYANATAVLSGTDLDSHLRFLDQAKQYRADLIRYLRDLKAFGSPAWYNPESGKKIDKEGIPLFRELPEPLSSGIRRATFDISILALLNLAFFLLTYLSFLKYDVR